MNDLESEIAELIRELANGAVGSVSCDCHPDGYSCMAKLPNILSDRRFENAVETYVSTASNGTWYRCDISIDAIGDVRFTHFWEPEQIASTADIPRYAGGGIPNFVFRKRFDKEIINAIEDDEIPAAIAVQFDYRFHNQLQIPEALFDLYAVGDWQCDVDNGEFKQYFGAQKCLDHETPRVEVYARVLSGLRRVGHAAAAEMFCHAICFYSQINPLVETVRQSLSLSCPNKVDYDDLCDRYWELRKSIETSVTQYVRNHFDELVTK